MKKMKKKQMFNLFSIFIMSIFLLSLVSVVSVFADEVITTSETNTTNTTDGTTDNTTLIDNTNQSVLINESQNAANLTDSAANQTTALPENITNTSQTQITDLRLVHVVPNEFKTGDIQFNLQIQNNGTTELKDIGAFITGKGFSTYEIVPIDSLKPNEKSYILVMGNVKEAGIIELTIKISDKALNKVFNRNITVIDTASVEDKEKLAELEKKDVEKKALVSGLLVELNDLKANFSMLEKELETKKDDNYDVSSVNLDDLKKLVRDAEAALIKGDSEQGEVSFTLALDEYKNQKIKIEEAKKIKKSFTQILRENALLISTFAGSLIALFTLIEILKKKKESLYQKIKEVKVDKNTRIVVEKKQNEKQDKQSKKEEDNDTSNFDLPGNDNN
ncbi:hypothetical protein HY636_05070 [Candidatus Woesearchaeota archaeon]|nr:hypothetical protein [Candidatus Woesearchaeota archaeon]